MTTPSDTSSRIWVSERLPDEIKQLIERMEAVLTLRAQLAGIIEEGQRVIIDTRWKKMDAGDQTLRIFDQKIETLKVEKTSIIDRLKTIGITTIGELVNTDPTRILKIPQIGAGKVVMLHDALAEIGLIFLLPYPAVVTQLLQKRAKKKSRT